MSESDEEEKVGEMEVDQEGGSQEEEEKGIQEESIKVEDINIDVKKEDEENLIKTK